MNRSHPIANRYEIRNPTTDQIGQGGMGDVYRAVDVQTGQIVAIKRLKPELVAHDPTIVERFGREGQALQRLNHPNIVAVQGTVEEDGQHYIIMEYVPGGSLLELLNHETQLPIHRVLQIALELADALARAHHLNIIHRDIKPANVLLAADGTPRLTDFGVAHMGDLVHITREGTFTGTYAYLSPEACNGEPLDSRTDIWSFGVMLYEMLTHHSPFEGANLMATITAILTRPTPDMAQFRSGIPDALSDLIQRVLEKDKNRRIGSMRLIGAQLEAILSGVGGQLLPETAKSRFAATTPSRQTAPLLGPRHNLPTPPTPFIGRFSEITDIVTLLQDPDCRLLTLVGPGGMGKTRLSIEAARQVVEQFKHGVRFVPLAGVSAAEFLITAVSDAVNFSFFNESDPKQQLLHYLRDKEMLLVMDNFEHLLAGANLVSDMLNSAPHLKILVTSREALNLWEEWSRPVRGMHYPEQAAITDIEPYSAIKLFADRARRTRSGFSLADEMPHVIRICQLVEGMPLGIELAATWLKVLSPEQIAQEISKNLDFLSSSIRNITTRHRSMRAVFDYSWQLLTADEQTVFRKLSAFRGGFSREAAEKVAGASLQTLTNLVNKSLLYEEAENEKGHQNYRYRMHELLRQYAAHKLAENEVQANQTGQAHTAYFMQLLHRQEPRLRNAEFKGAYELIRTNMENIRAAWVWAVNHLADVPQAVNYLEQGANALSVYYDSNSQIPEAQQFFDEAVTAVSHLPNPTESPQHTFLLAKLLTCQGMVVFRTPRRLQSLELFQQSLNLLNQLITSPDTPQAMRQDAEQATILPLVYCSFSVARVQTQEAGIQMVEEAIKIGRRLNDLWGLSRALNAFAILNMHLDAKQLLPIYQESLQLARIIGDPVMTIRALMNLASLAQNYTEAMALLQECLELNESLDNVVGKANVYTFLGDWAVLKGEFQKAKAHREKALLIYEEIGFQEYLPYTLTGLTEITWSLGEVTEAQHHIERAIAVVKEVGDIETLMDLFQIRARLLFENGEYEAARQQYKIGLAIVPQLSSARQKARVLDILGNMALLLGEYGAAKKHFEETIPYFREAQDESGVAWAFRNFGLIAHDLGDYQTACTHFEESLALHRQASALWAVLQLLTDLGRTTQQMGDIPLAWQHYREALKIALALPDALLRFISLDTLVYVARLLAQIGERERALECLLITRRHPLFTAPYLPKRIRDKAYQLATELQNELEPEKMGALLGRIQACTYRDLMAEIVAHQ